MTETTTGPVTGPSPARPGLSRRRMWSAAAGSVAAVAGIAALDAASPAAAAAGTASTTSPGTSAALRRLVDRRLQDFGTRLLETVLPEAVGSAGPLRRALDQRYLPPGAGAALTVSAATVVLTRGDYEALPAPDPATLYLIVE